VTDVRFVDETPFGFGWIAPEPKFMQRCSHALRVGESVWVTDPVAADGVVDRIRALGEPAGVLVLIDRHARDSERVAQELGVPRYVAPQEPPIAPFDLVPLGKERALWLPEHAALVVGEALGTVQYYRTSGWGSTRFGACCLRASSRHSSRSTCCSATAKACTGRRRCRRCARRSRTGGCERRAGSGPA
jgi:hypothetical protein